MYHIITYFSPSCEMYNVQAVVSYNLEDGNFIFARFNIKALGKVYHTPTLLTYLLLFPVTDLFLLIFLTSALR